MISTTPPIGTRFLADRYKDLMTLHYADVCGIFAYFLLSCRSLSEFVRGNPWARSVSTLSRGIQKFPVNRFVRRMRSSILKNYSGHIKSENFIWAIDDTANPKYGKKMFRAGHWHGSSGPWFGHKVIVLSLVDIEAGIALPIAYVIAPKKNDPEYKTGQNIAVDLLKCALNEGFPCLPVALDSWFDSKELMEDIKNLGMTYVGELKNNRKVKSNPGPNVRKKTLESCFKNEKRYRLKTRFDSEKVRKRKKKAKVAAQKRLWLNGMHSALNVIAVYNRRNGKEAFGYYGTTDLSMSGSRLWEISRGRWKIEVMFRDLRQNLSFGVLPCSHAAAADLSICIPMIILVNLRLHVKDCLNLEEKLTVGDMIDQVKENSLIRSIDYLLTQKNPERINKLKSRRSLKRLNKKPIDRLAETG